MTLYTGPTPYDAQIEELLQAASVDGDQIRIENSLRKRAEGYRLAKTEDMELLKIALTHIAGLHQTHEALFGCKVADLIRAALAQRKEEEVK